MSNTDLLITIGCSILSGIGVWIMNVTYYNRKEKQKEQSQKLIKFPNTERVIDNTIFDKLSPGRSIELMKTALGTPDKTFTESEPIFIEHREEEEGLMVYEFSTEEDRIKYEETKYETTAYFYNFKNAQVKITSKDKETIDSLAVQVEEGTLDISDLPLGFAMSDEDSQERILLGKTIVNRELVQSSRLEYVFSRYDNVIVMSVYTAAPLYTHYTYFGYPDYREDVELDKENPDSFVGGTITGVCLHRDEYDSYIIRGYDNI